MFVVLFPPSHMSKVGTIGTTEHTMQPAPQQPTAMSPRAMPPKPAAGCDAGPAPAVKLVLHFDINETVMVGDPAGGDTFEDCLNKIICKNAFVRSANGTDPLAASSPSDLVWWDGTPLSSEVAPALLSAWEWPSGCVPFYKIEKLKKQCAKHFTEADCPGRAYRPLWEELERALRVAAPLDGRLCHDGVHHFLLPAFFHTLRSLHDAGRDFAVVVRTFGADGADAARALTAWAGGQHDASLPPVASLAVDPQTAVYRGKYDGGADGSESRFVLRPEPDGGAAGAALQEQEALELIEARGADAPRAVVCTDDYGWWRGHGYAPSAGKPLWLTLDDTSTHHIFFDDNIHHDAADSIVAVRHRPSAAHPFQPASGEATVLLQGVCLVRVPTYEPILRRDWFLDRIAECERARAERFSTAEQQRAVFDAGAPPPRA